MSLKLTILIVVILQLINLTITEKPYQVIIWLKSDYYKNPIGKPLCNGIVIHERLVLTTATCLRNTTNISTINNNLNSNDDDTDTENVINTTNLTKPAVIELTTPESNLNSAINSNINLKFIQLNASEIIILGGNYNIITQNQKPIIKNISEIEIAQNFNATSLENDIALLKLNESLPLSTRRDIQWISLDDHTAYRNTSCTISFSNFMTKNTQETFTVKLMNNQNCTNITNFQSLRKTDICSLYVNPSICNLSESHLIRIDDRGTGLVCDSKLIGVLSQIIPIDTSSTKCSDFEPFKAIYTRVANHLNWIYEKIAIESMADLGKSNYILAPQYKESAPSPSIQMPQEQQLLEKPSAPASTTTIKTPQNVVENSSSFNYENRTGTETKINSSKTETQISNSKPGVGKSFGVLSKSISLKVFSISIILALIFNY